MQHDCLRCLVSHAVSFRALNFSTLDLPPPPDNITLSEIHLAPTQAELRFNWTKTMIKNCQISYNITSDCGDCPTSTPINRAICFSVPVNNPTCSFAVRTIVCGSIGTHSNSISVTLKGIAKLYTFSYCVCTYILG